MPKVRLSKSVIDNFSDCSSDMIFWDTSLVGFGVRVKPNNTKSYVVQYRNRSTGRSRRKTIGQHGPLMSFAQAKEIATGLLSDVLRGHDPVAASKLIRSAPTVSDLGRQYLEVHAIPKKRPRSVANDESMLSRHILPKLAGYKVSEVGHQDIQTLHNSLKSTPYQANRTIALVSKMFELSIKWGWRSDNPVKGIERFHEEKRHRWLSEEELARLIAALDDHPNSKAANAIRLQLLTGARIGEVLTSKWTDFDFDRGVWIKPSHHTKQKRTEHLPLSAAACELLVSMREANEAKRILFFPERTRTNQSWTLRSFGPPS